MIIKKSVMNNKNLSSYSRLIKYLISNKDNNKMDIDRNFAVWSNSEHYENEDLSLYVKEIKSVQRMNTRSSDDRTYHLIVSFKEDEIELNKMKEIEKDIITALGFEEHQRICVVHNDTDNLHLHIAINKVHPKTNKIFNPYNDYMKMSQIANAVENKYNLEKDNHMKSDKIYSAAVNIEKSGHIKSLKSYIDEINLEQVSSWSEFHSLLNTYGVMYLKKGAGAIFSNQEKKIYIKPSVVNRNYSLKQLEQRFGAYQAYKYDFNKTEYVYKKEAIKDKNNIYDDFLKYNENRVLKIEKELNQIEISYQRDLYKESQRIKKILDIVLSDASYMEKVIINKVYNNILKDKQKKLYKDKYKERQKVYKYNKYQNFDEWLRKEALQNNNKAIKYITDEINKQNYIVDDFTDEYINAIKVTRKGTYILQNSIRIREEGVNIRSLHEYHIKKNIEYYKKKYPNKKINIKGTEQFINKFIEIAANNDDLNIEFENPEYNNMVHKIKEKKRIEENNILIQFNNEQNQLLYKYKIYDNKKYEYEYRGFIKHEEEYFILLKSEEDRTFYVKKPTKEDYKKIKYLHKGSAVNITDDKHWVTAAQYSLIKQQEEKRIKYEEYNSNLKELNFEGVRKYNNKLIYLYKNNEGNRIYTKIATKEDIQQYKENKKEERNINKR